MPIKTRSITLIQGVFDTTFFDFLKRRRAANIFVLEGRPGLEAARQSCRELLRRNIKSTLITDNMAGFFFYNDYVRDVWLAYGAFDREGILCQTGGLILSVLGKRHKVPVYAYPAGHQLKMIGKPADLLCFNGVRVAPQGISSYVPLAEWVTLEYITRQYHGKKLN